MSDIPQNNILSVDSDDNNINYKEFNKFLQEDTNRKKNKTVLEIEEMGNLYLKEIDRKKKKKEPIKIKLISYILSHDDKYSEEELISYSFEDVQTIYHSVKYDNRSIFRKIIDFIFNIE